jgi:hypothetical protein
MNKQTTPRKVYTIGTNQYILPFVSAGFYVNDSKGSTVLEARTFQAAKDLSKILNDLAQL